MNGPERKKGQDDKPVIYPPFKKALIASAVFHVVVMILLVFGVPFISFDRKIPEPITVELASMADLSDPEKPPVAAPKTPEPEKPKPEPGKATEKLPEKPASNPNPKPPAPKPEKPRDKPQEVKKDPPPQDELTPDKKPEDKPKEKEKPKEDPKKAEEQEQQMQSLLKNLTKEAPRPKADISDITKRLTANAPIKSDSAVGQSLTPGELDALRQQLSQCWNVFAGAADAGDLSVDIRVIANPDRTVQDARIVDQSRYNSDDRFRAAADSAMRAIKDLRCSPLNVPPEKYDLWHDMIINFDPKDML